MVLLLPLAFCLDKFCDARVRLLQRKVEGLRALLDSSREYQNYLKDERDKAHSQVRQLKETLWATRAAYCHNFREDWYIRRHPNTTQTEKAMANKMIVAEMDCRAKFFKMTGRQIGEKLKS